jgi:glycosyltransferase involved in cell wall biosynthesis
LNILVSVIIPNYNHATYLKQRIESVLNQTYPDFEVIILDDASTDNSREIIEGYRGHEKINQIIYNEQNSGSVFRQWKKGIELAKGEYIWIAESDDYCESDLLENLIEPFRQLKKVTLSFCQSWIVNDSGKILRDNKIWTDSIDSQRWSADFLNDGQDEVRNYLLFKNCIPNASAVVFRKDALSNHFDYPYQWLYAGDWFTWINILEKGSIYFVKEKLNYFRTHENTTRHYDTFKKMFKRVEEEYQLIAYVVKHFDIERESIRRAHYNLLEQWIKNYTNGFVPSKQFRRLYKLASKYDARVSVHFILLLLNKLKHFIKMKIHTANV